MFRISGLHEGRRGVTNFGEALGGFSPVELEHGDPPAVFEDVPFLDSSAAVPSTTELVRIPSLVENIYKVVLCML